MCFRLPSNLDQIPKPRDSRIHIKSVASSQFAVIKFSGNWNLDTIQQKADDFLQNIYNQNTGPIILAKFNSPSTVYFLKTNELWVRYKEK